MGDAREWWESDKECWGGGWWGGGWKKERRGEGGEEEERGEGEGGRERGGGGEGGMGRRLTSKHLYGPAHQYWHCSWIGMTEEILPTTNTDNLKITMWYTLRSTGIRSNVSQPMAPISRRGANLSKIREDGWWVPCGLAEPPPTYTHFFFGALGAESTAALALPHPSHLPLPVAPQESGTTLEVSKTW